MTVANVQRYVLITPARNEEAYLERTAQSIISQTLLPQKWVIVSDGSTDRTDTIVKDYVSRYPFIQLVRRETREYANFGAKVQAFNEGLAQVKDVAYEFIGNLDADVALEPFYYEAVLERFRHNPKLGLAGGTLFDVYEGKPTKIFGSVHSVRGAVQLFRRQCFEDIGGYPTSARSAIDTIAEVMARMHGWEVRTFFDLTGLHLRPIGGTQSKTIAAARIRQGEADYSLGYHPLFEFIKCLRRLREHPFFLGSALRLCGYVRAGMRGDMRPVSDNFVTYLRQEQMSRLRQTLPFLASSR